MKHAGRLLPPRRRSARQRSFERQMDAWEWYGLLCFLAVLNPTLYVLALRRYPLDPNPARAKYQRVLRLLALPMVLQCAWRGVFPSLYLQRYTFWDTPLNSILVDRSFACVGELAWNAQIALTMLRLDLELTDGTHWIRFSALTLFGLFRGSNHCRPHTPSTPALSIA